ncbi:putative disease resistance protein RGA1 [Mangifera indica]|uniref:putative disease resistance protein RGA1 n=1 Tax=Mangifera indica TaxID=29780 RepID=UPI001CFB253A|nr:putative disease resistance protein RGA1 [Mangifera indica]
MAETIVSVIAGELLSKVMSLTSNKISFGWGVKNDVQELAGTLTTIKVVLLDAEEKQTQNEKLRVWLEKLKEVCYDVEDVLDEIEVKDLCKQVMNGQSISRKVRHFFSSSNPIVFHFRLGHKIKEINKRLAKIATEKDDFNLTEKIYSNNILAWERETHSFVRASDVIGRDKDKEEVMKILLCPSDGHENVSVISIVGIGGLGKTTLAKLVYNDDKVSDYFKLKMWICVSDEFSLKRLLIDIINSTIGQKYNHMSMDQLQTILHDIIRDKKYLLVLDDVWNENYELWYDLRNLLMECVNGSKIIVTTRSDHVASIMGSVSTYKLKGLSLNQCLSVFVKYAFKEGQEKQYPNLLDIGKEIVKKCRGVPLAIRALGSLLYSSNFEQDWINVRDTEIWKLDQKDNSILHALRISYNHLSSPLKQCFVFCSIFPKDFIFCNFNLIKFWMANGLLKAHNENEDLETIGMQYIKELMWRSFFQDIQDFGNGVYSFKIHDLMHDVATSLFQNEGLIVKGSNQITTKTSYRHLLCHLDASQEEAPSFLPNQINNERGNLRSITFFTRVEENITVSQSFLELIVSRFQFLRLLHLSGLGIETVPKTIGNLKHLRYLELSCNPKIKKLPSSIYKLQSVQFLSLYDCKKLEELNGDVKYLISLRGLALTTVQKHLPNNGIGCLNSLRFLVIHNCSKLKYLCEDIGRLRVIRRLHISKCPSLISLPRGIKSLSSLEELRLNDCVSLNLDLSIESDEQHNHEELNSTGSPLRLLEIGNLPQLVKLPQWLLRCSTNTLQTLRIGNCSNLKALPESMQKLQALRVWNCPELSSLPKDINHLIALRELIIKDCPKLTERCKPEGGEDWPKIAHIQKIELDGEVIKSTEN